MHKARILPPTAGAILVAIAATGCQTYQPAPLDPEAHHQAWLARTPADEPVAEFAARLAALGDHHAANFNPHDGLTLHEAQLVALVFNPNLRLARLHAGVAAATAENAGRWEDPELVFDVLRIIESVSNPWVISPGLAFTIPISGRLDAEKDRAGAQLAAQLDRVAEQEWSTSLEVRRAWLTLSALQLRLDETTRLVDSMNSLVASTTALAQSGEMVRTEAALFALEQMQRRLEQRGIQGDIQEADQHLRALLGLSPAAPVTFLPSLDLAANPEPDPADLRLDQRNPTLIRLKQEYEVAEQTLRREITKQYPDLTIGPLYESDQGQSRIGLLGALPIPILNANAQGIAEARANRRLAQAAFETRDEQIRAEIAAARIRAQTRTAQRDQILTDMAPLVDRQLDSARSLLEIGESGGLVLLESLVRAHETKMQLIDARLGEALAAAQLEFLRGPDPNTPAPPSTNSEVEQ